MSDEALEKFVGDLTLDEALENIGLWEISSGFRIEFDDGWLPFGFPGWHPDDDGLARLALA
jgi:hypothetical protein